MATSNDDQDVFVLNRNENAEETPYWQPDVSKVLQPRTQQMLETYSKIPPGQVIDHIKNIQKRSWAVSPFPSVGALTWLNPYLLLHPAYPQVLSQLEAGSSILDCACMVAPDLRQLAFDGAPTENMYGFDIEPEFFNIGFDFYNDREKWKGKFFHADATQPFDQSELGALAGKLDIVYCAKFVHIFDKENQIKMMVKLVSLLKPQKGSMFVGSQNGFPTPIDIPNGNGQKFPCQTDTLFLADAASMESMWQTVAKETGTEWHFESNLLDLRTIGLHEDDGSPYKRFTGYNLQWLATMK